MVHKQVHKTIRFSYKFHLNKYLSKHKSGAYALLAFLLYNPNSKHSQTNWASVRRNAAISRLVLAYALTEHNNKNNLMNVQMRPCLKPRRPLTQSEAALVMSETQIHRTVDSSLVARGKEESTDPTSMIPPNTVCEIPTLVSAAWRWLSWNISERKTAASWNHCTDGRWR